MVFGIGLGITVLLKKENGFFITYKFKKDKNENRKAGEPGIVQTGIRT